VSVYVDIASEPGGEVVDVARTVVGVVDVEGKQEPASSAQDAAELLEGLAALEIAQVDDRVQRGNTRPSAVVGGQAAHVGDAESVLRPAATGDMDNRPGQVQPDHVAVAVGEEGGDVSWAAADVGQRAAGTEHSQCLRQRAV
jgi:hypothetical protein